jgi:hypothetical protein
MALCWIQFGASVTNAFALVLRPMASARALGRPSDVLRFGLRSRADGPGRFCETKDRLRNEIDFWNRYAV